MSGSQVRPDTLRSPAPWSSLRLPADSSRLRFAVIGDNTDAARPGVLASAVARLNLLRPDFVLNVGDLIQGYSTDTVMLDREWREVDSTMAGLRMPFFRVPGNHDVENPVEVAVWKKRYGATTYSFTHKNILFLCMNSVDSGYGNLTVGQLKEAEKILQRHAGARWTFVFMHMPLWDRQYKPEAGWGALRRLLAGRPYTAFAGHYHEYALEHDGGSDHVTLATTGGGSQLRGPSYGEFDHLVWVTMTEEGPEIANLMLDGIGDKGIRTAAMRTAMDSLREPGNCAVMPILFAGKSTTGGKTAFVLRNSLAQDIALTFRLEPTDPGATVTCETGARTVAAGSAIALPITVSLKGQPTTADRTVARLHWTAVVRMADTVRLAGDARVALVRELPCPVAAKPIVLDGSLADWSTTFYECSRPAQVRKAAAKWRGPKDSRFSFGVARDTANLYVGVKVVDDTVVTPKEFSWDDDCLELHLWVAPDSVRLASGEPSDDGTNFIIAINTPANDRDTARVFPWTLPKGGRWVVRRTVDGFIAEVAVPVATIDSVAGRGWTGFRLLTAYGDRDGGEVATIWWRPWADAPDWYPGAGAFRMAAK